MATVQHVDPGTRRHTQTIVHALAGTIRERDIITYEHSRRVAVYAYRLARHMGWTRRTGRDLALAGQVHDLGKTWIHNDLLHKDSALSRDERHRMEQHPRTGARFLQIYGAPDWLADIVLRHHEAYDGRGYPDGLIGKDIPIGARMLTVCDVFDALSSERSYKPTMTQQDACEVIASAAGTHFDPEIVSAFLAMLDANSDFCLPPRVCPLPIRIAPYPTWVRHDDIIED